MLMVLLFFNLSGELAFNGNKVQQMELFPQNSKLQLVVINVYGKTVSWSGGNLVGTWFDTVTTGRSHTIWNFYEATTITFDSNIKGAVLAPYATLTTRINIDGAVAVKSLDAGGEVHLPLLVFPTCTTGPTSTPASQFFD